MKLFLDMDEERANKELDCYGDCLATGIENFMETDFEKAALEHENIARSLKELARLKERKIEMDTAAYYLNQINEEEKRRLLFHLEVNIYE